MGYDIKPISEINTIDKTLCSGYPNVNLYSSISNDGNFFIVEGETFNTYTLEEILIIRNGANWTEQAPI